MNQQQEHWTGNEGKEYAARSPGDATASYVMFRKIQDANPDLDPKSVIEFGAGMGTNLSILPRVWSGIHRTGVEINKDTCLYLAEHCERMICSPLQDLKPMPQVDLTYTRGVLIHIPKQDLNQVYDLLYHSSKRWIMVAEYYSPKRTMIPYRGKDNLLWKDDFAGQIMDRYQDLKLIDYGFVYYRDPIAPQGDITWFLMEKQGLPVFQQTPANLAAMESDLLKQST